jgi:hypothetical protein
MSDITPWAPEVYINMISWPKPGVQTYVTMEDHVAAVAAAEQRGIQKALIAWKEAEPLQSAEDFAAGVKAAREAVEVSPYCCNCTAPTTTSGEHDDWCMVFKILAAIDGITP